MDDGSIDVRLPPHGKDMVYIGSSKYAEDATFTGTYWVLPRVAVVYELEVVMVLDEGSHATTRVNTGSLDTSSVL